MANRTDITPSDVFVSWTGADRELKNSIVTYLASKGISCLESDSECCGDFGEWSVEAVSACSVFLLILTENTLKSEYVPVELEEAKGLEDYKNRILPVCVSSELYKQGYGGLNEFCSAIFMENGGLSEKTLEEINGKVNKLLINRFYNRYRDNASPSFIRLVPLWSGIGLKRTEDLSFERLYIKRKITEITDDNEYIESYFDPSPVIRSGAVSFLYGEGGCGKSQYLNYVSSVAEGDTLPFIISFEKYHESGKELFSYLYERFYSVVGKDLPYSEASFSRLITAKKLLLMFDGMDEIASDSITRALIKSVGDFCSALSGEVTLIFTSRNKRDADDIVINGKRCISYYMEKLSEEEIEELSANLFLLFGNEEKGGAFYEKTSGINAEIRSNPLLLTQLAIVYNTTGELPETSYGILNAVTDIILRLDDEKGLINTDLLKNLRFLLKRFAKERYNLVSDGRTVEAVKVFKHILKSAYADYEARAEFLCEYLKNRAILVEGEFFHKRFLEFFTAVAYYDDIFGDYDTLENTDELNALFSNYQKPYWSPVIEMFLLKADSEIDKSETAELYAKIIENESVSDYSLLFDTAKYFSKNRDTAQVTVLRDVLYKSAEKICAPYGPLFYYVPEYELYPQAIMAADALRGNARALALVRDVCFIFGHIDRASDACASVDDVALYNAAKPQLSGVRDALCELFCTGKTDFEGGDNIYPRCFNPKEARLFALTDHGSTERMTEPFSDELSLYDESVSAENRELIGLVTVPFRKYGVENLFKKHSTKKVTGIIFTPTDYDVFTYISIYRKKLKVVYYPENCPIHSSDYDLHFDLMYYVFWTEKQLLYVRKQPTVTLPGEIGALPKLILSGFAFVEKLILSEGISFIADRGLNGPASLKSIEFPHSLKKEAITFEIPRNISEIIVPNDCVEQYERMVGSQNVTEKRVLDKKTVISILSGDDRDRSLRGRLDLVSYKVRNEKHVCQSMFEGCVNLKDVKLPSKTPELPDRIFYGCTSLENIMMPWFPKSIGNSAFENCTSIWRIFLPEAITEIKSRAFANCVNLKKLFLPEKVQIIGDEAFLNCIRISFVHITPDVQYVSPTAFSGCSSLKIIEAPRELEFEPPEIDGLQVVRYEPAQKRPGQILTVGEMQNSLEKENAVKLTDEELDALLDNGHFEVSDFMDAVNIALRKKASSVTIKEGVTYVPARYFAGCSNLKRIIFPSTLPVIRSETFRECTGLTELVFPENLKNITTNSFRDCTSLENVIFGHNTLLIGNYAFYGCSSLKTLRIPKAVRRIGKGAFYGCTSLRRIRISRNFEENIDKIFGPIDRSIIEFY